MPSLRLSHASHWNNTVIAESDDAVLVTGIEMVRNRVAFGNAVEMEA